MTNEQYESVKEIIQTILTGTYKSIFVKGSAGTGKTILAIFLIKLLVTDIDNLFDYDESENPDEINLIAALKKKYPNPKVALVVPMTSLRNTLKSVFKKIGGLKADMVIGPNGLAKESYDVVLVDEAHRLKRRVNLTGYGAYDAANEKLGLGKQGTQLDWVLKQSKNHILFYDPQQSIKPTDIPKADFDKVVNQSQVIQLASQMRVKGGNDYISFVDKLLNVTLESDVQPFSSNSYELLLFDSISDMRDLIQQKDVEHGLSRIIAGFSWPWVSQKEVTHKDYKEFDIQIQGVNFKWNTEASNWINSKNASQEVGCIHTTQGYDLNYAAIIFGNEITFDPVLKEIVIIPENYHDKKGKGGITDISIMKSYIINIYKTMMYRGIRGTFVYACDENLRNYLKQYIESYIAEATTIRKLPVEDVIPYENAVPFYDIYAAAGAFSELQISEDIEWIKLERPFKASYPYEQPHIG